MNHRSTSASRSATAAERDESYEPAGSGAPRSSVITSRSIYDSIMASTWGPGLFENDATVDVQTRWDAAEPDSSLRLKLHFELSPDQLPKRGTIEWRQLLSALAAR
jgi:hypothetical protein